MKALNALLLTAILAGLALLFGCVHKPEPEKFTVVPITDMAYVAGRWQGMVERLGQRDWAEMMIQGDGAYRLRSYRGIGVYNGQGVFSLHDGKLSAQSEKGKVVYVLQRTQGQEVLSLKGFLNGLDYTGHFTRVAE